MSRDLYNDDPSEGSGESDDGDGYGHSKRARTGGLGFGDTAAEGVSAEAELEAMLAAERKNMGSGSGGGIAAGGKSMGQPQPTTTQMDFSRPTRELPTQVVPVPKEMTSALMTNEHRVILTEESGADVEFSPAERSVVLRGSKEQIKRATRLLQRVITHCHWGANEPKVKRLLRPVMVESAVCRLSPMNTLRPFHKTLNMASPFMTIGKDKTNDVCIPDPMISRQHCVLELDIERGSVYAIDCSTNGTYLNSVRIPGKTVGKVLITHGDELLFKDPALGDKEFGYIVNLQELTQKVEARMGVPRRLLAGDDIRPWDRQ